MLIEREKYNLNQLLERYSFEHLRPPPQVFQIKHDESAIWKGQTENVRKRHIFWKTEYTQKELGSLEQIKKYLHQKGIFQNFSDPLILKHLHSTNFDLDKTFQRLQKLQAFHNDKMITKFTYQTLKRLQSGCIYSYGFDREFHPFLIIRADRFKVDSESKKIQHQISKTFNCAYFLLLVVMNFKMVPYHSEKYITVMDFNNMDIKNIPYKFLYQVVTKMDVYFCKNAHRAFIFNAKKIKGIWDMTMKFLPARSSENIHFVEEGKEDIMLQYADPMELEKRYGGQLQNLEKYWPPQSTNAEFNELNNLTQSQITQFYSVQNDEEMFQEEKSDICSTENCHCTIF